MEEPEYLLQGWFWGLMRWIFDGERWCRWGLHSNWKYDGEWTNTCAFCCKSLGARAREGKG